MAWSCEANEHGSPKMAMELKSDAGTCGIDKVRIDGGKERNQDLELIQW
jgi:hypothetical protein